MRAFLTICALVSFGALLAPLGAAAEEREITGSVLDGEGNPLADVEVATYWTCEGERWKARGGVRTDAEGRFVLTLSWSGRSRSLLAFDDGQERGAVALLDEDTLAEPVALRLEPTTRVHGAFACPELGPPPEQAYVSVTAEGVLIAAASYAGPPAFSFPLPPGAYALRVKGTDCERVTKRISLTADMQAVDLGTTDLEPTVIARHYGRPPPDLRVTAARGVDQDIRLADLRGRWVLLEFWGHW